VTKPIEHPNLVENPDSRLKRFCITIKSEVIQENIQNIFDELIEDTRLIEYFGVSDDTDGNSYTYVEYNYKKRVAPLLKTFKKHMDLKYLVVRKLRCEKKLLFNEMVKVGIS
jgi:hypothetical protein